MTFENKYEELRQADYGHCRFMWEEAQKEILEELFKEGKFMFSELKELKERFNLK